MFTFYNTQGNDNLKAFKKTLDGMKLYNLIFFLTK